MSERRIRTGTVGLTLVRPVQCVTQWTHTPPPFCLDLRLLGCRYLLQCIASARFRSSYHPPGMYGSSHHQV